MYVSCTKVIFERRTDQSLKCKKGNDRYRIMHDYDKMKLKQGGTNDKE